jgi:hypothetical protein
MAEKLSEAGPIRRSSRTDTLNYRNRQDQARSARHAQATLEAAELFQLYPSGTVQPIGCLSLYSARGLSLTADRAALMDAVSTLLAQDLAETSLPDPSPA